MHYGKRPFNKISDAYLSDELDRVSAAFEGLRWIKVSKSYELSTSGTLVIADADVTRNGVVMAVSDDYDVSASAAQINGLAGFNTVFRLDRSGAGHNGTYVMIGTAQNNHVDHGLLYENWSVANHARLWVESAGANAKLKIHWLLGAPIKVRFVSIEVNP
jgi:archaellum component FlaF (FlaF/FlaG flagellin family)